jgi:signal recognition particle receptor subunit beta
MVQINFGERQVNAKIVYYGPGMSGKTTNLEIVYQKAPPTNRGELTSISTDGDRTLFFDFMPLDLGTVAGLKTSFQIYTVPGQVYYNSTRKLVLQGVDGVVFVADSSASMVEENLESLRNLEQNLAEYGKSLEDVPFVIQYNKRDLPDALPVEELERLLNPHGVPSFEAVANTGHGVFPTLKALAAVVIQSIHAGARGPAAPTAVAPAPAPVPVMAGAPAPVAMATTAAAAKAIPLPSIPSLPSTRTTPESLSKTNIRPLPMPPVSAPTASAAPTPPAASPRAPAAYGTQPPRTYAPPASARTAPRTAPRPEARPEARTAPRSTPQAEVHAESTPRRSFPLKARDVLIIVAALAVGAAAMHFAGGLL